MVCGFYRTGKNFGYQHYKFTPDIVCMAKSITGGFIPFGATFFSHEISSTFNNKVLSAGLTNYAHPLGLAATKAIIKIVSTKVFQARLNKNIKILREFLLEQKYSSSCLETRQFGMLAALELKNETQPNLFLEKGFHLIQKNKTLIFSPNLLFPSKELKKSLDEINKIIIQNEREKNVLKKTG